MSQTRKIARRIARITETLEALSALDIVLRPGTVDRRRLQFDKVAKRGQRPSWALIGNSLSGERRRMKRAAAQEQG